MTIPLRRACLALLSAASVVAQAGAERADAPNAPARPAPGLKFDGLWEHPGGVTLVKQLKTRLVLQGKDAVSTWHARCELEGEVARCRGEGEDNDESKFAYESVLTWGPAGMSDEWKATYVRGQVVAGKSVLQRMALPATDRAR